MSGARVVREHRWEMGITRAEFMRLLPGAVQGAYEAEGDRLAGRAAGCAWRIEIDTLEARRMAAIAVPAIEVRLRVDAPSDDDAERFVRRFVLGFQRAGG